MGCGTSVNQMENVVPPKVTSTNVEPVSVSEIPTVKSNNHIEDKSQV